MNEQYKKGIRDNHKGFPVAVHYNQADHFINDLPCVILNGNFTTTADRQLHQQKLIQRFDSNKCGLNRDFGFLSKYDFFQQVTKVQQIMTYDFRTDVICVSTCVCFDMFVKQSFVVYHGGRPQAWLIILVYMSNC